MIGLARNSRRRTTPKLFKKPALAQDHSTCDCDCDSDPNCTAAYELESSQTVVAVEKILLVAERKLARLGR